MRALTPQAIRVLIRRALQEDVASRDVTSRAVIPAGLRIRARIVAKAHGVAAGVKVAALTFAAVDPSVRCRLVRRDGSTVRPGSVLLTVEGRTRSIFAAERVALNVLGHLSGIATLTRAYANRARGTRAKIYDTRKTLPGLRGLEKYAVQVGGGHNHRMDLADAVLIKTNHLRALRGTVRGSGVGNRESWCSEAVRRARRQRPEKFVEIEVANLHEFGQALHVRPDALLLDNWRRSDIRRAVLLLREFRSTIHDPRSTRRAVPLLEVSGGVTLANVRAIAKTGVDRISIGRLTHSAPSLDVSLEVVS